MLILFPRFAHPSHISDEITLTSLYFISLYLECCPKSAAFKVTEVNGNEDGTTSLAIGVYDYDYLKSTDSLAYYILLSDSGDGKIIIEGGVWVIVATKDGTTEIYKIPPRAGPTPKCPDVSEEWKLEGRTDTIFNKLSLDVSCLDCEYTHKILPGYL